VGDEETSLPDDPIAHYDTLDVSHVCRYRLCTARSDYTSLRVTNVPRTFLKYATCGTIISVSLPLHQTLRVIR
jgi:hypothetical protein